METAVPTMLKHAHHQQLWARAWAIVRQPLHKVWWFQHFSQATIGNQSMCLSQIWSATLDHTELSERVALAHMHTHIYSHSYNLHAFDNLSDLALLPTERTGSNHCHCDALCTAIGDCCEDATDACSINLNQMDSCRGQCHLPFPVKKKDGSLCYCVESAKKLGNQCGKYVCPLKNIERVE